VLCPFGRDHGRYPIYTTADELSAQGLSCVELWLPEGKRIACAEEISDSPHRLFLTRQIAIASGFAAPLLGINVKKLSDEELEKISKEYRLVHLTFL